MSLKDNYFQSQQRNVGYHKTRSTCTYARLEADNRRSLYSVTSTDRNYTLTQGRWNCCHCFFCVALLGILLLVGWRRAFSP